MAARNNNNSNNYNNNTESNNARANARGDESSEYDFEDSFLHRHAAQSIPEQIRQIREPLPPTRRIHPALTTANGPESQKHYQVVDDELVDLVIPSTQPEVPRQGNHEVEEEDLLNRAMDQSESRVRKAFYIY